MQAWHNHVWGVPYATYHIILFFNKPKLKELGWSDEKIAELPIRIRTGNFTLDQMFALAKQAVDADVVEPGMGFWPGATKTDTFKLIYMAYGGRFYSVEQHKPVISQGALASAYTFTRQLLNEQIMHGAFVGNPSLQIIPRNVWRDAFTHGRVLFWTTVNNDWSEWTVNYMDDLGGLDYQTNTIGYALFPSAQPGTPGYTRWIGTSYYIIPSEKATGRHNQDAACAVLAQTITPEINALHAARFGSLGVLKSQITQHVASASRYMAETAYMWNYAKLDYDWQASPHAYAPDGVLLEFMEKAERGELTAAAAAATAVRHLRSQYGDVLIVEQ